MTSTTREEAIRLLAEISELCREVRLGQLMANLSNLARGPANA
jgi:hypothetical protein